MKIEKPLEDYDIYIMYDFLDLEYMLSLKEQTIHSLCYGDNLVNDFERSVLKEPVPPKGIEEKSLDLLQEAMKKALHEIYKDDSITKYSFYPSPNTRTPEAGKRQGKMKQHIDGPPEDLGMDHGVKTYGAVYYLTDQFDGGELVYPKLNFKFKPVANSLILHPGKEPYWHGVDEINNGWRICFGMIATEEYNLDDFYVYGNADGIGEARG